MGSALRLYHTFRFLGVCWHLMMQTTILNDYRKLQVLHIRTRYVSVSAISP